MTRSTLSPRQTAQILQARLRRILKYKPVSQKQICVHAGLGVSTIQNILGGNSLSPRADTLQRLERTLGLPVGYLTAAQEDREALAAHYQSQIEQSAIGEQGAEPYKPEISKPDEDFYPPHPEEFAAYISDAALRRDIAAGLITTQLFDPNEGIDTPALGRQVPLLGAIGAGGHIDANGDIAGDIDLDRVTAPPGSAPETVAAIVRGGSFYPYLRDGTLIYWSQRVSNIDDHLNTMIICHLADGRVAVKIIKPGSSRGLYTLESPSAPPLQNVALDSVSPIDWMKL